MRMISNRLEFCDPEGRIIWDMIISVFFFKFWWFKIGRWGDMITINFLIFEFSIYWGGGE